jgi:N-acyl-D-amino-acid deacylase
MNHFDTVIRGGTVADPQSMRQTIANIGILDGSIAAITREDIQGASSIDATGKVVCPGFIDIHSHVEGNPDCARLMAAMGVTTVYNGNCGHSPAGDFEAFLAKYEAEGFLINQIEQVGHTTLRETVGLQNRYAPASPEQVRAMEILLRQAFELGAWGLSFGLEYVPGSSTQEVLALSKIAAAYGKLVSIHTRTDLYSGLSSLQEAVGITRATGAAVNVSHLVYQYGFGMATESLHILEEAFAEGLDVSVDSGLYSSFATSIGSAVFDEGCVEKWHCGYGSIVMGTGKYRGQRLTRETYLEMRRDSPRDTAIAFVGRDHEIYEILDKPYVMVSTDAGTLYDSGLPGHPQDAGTYPRFFRTMVREQGRLTLLEAIRRCTLMPADRLGLKTKGRISIGADADLVVFDPAVIEDRAQFPCFGDTSATPLGIDSVLVSGVNVSSGANDLKPGKIYKATAKKWSWQ